MSYKNKLGIPSHYTGSFKGSVVAYIDDMLIWDDLSPSFLSPCRSPWAMSYISDLVSSNTGKLKAIQVVRTASSEGNHLQVVYRIYKSTTCRGQFMTLHHRIFGRDFFPIKRLCWSWQAYGSLPSIAASFWRVDTQHTDQLSGHLEDNVISNI